MKQRRSLTALFPEATRRALLLVNYYGLLNEHAPFHDALRALHEEVRALRERVSEDEEAALDQERRLLEQFVAEWHLPLGQGVADVRYSLALPDSGLCLLLSPNTGVYMRQSFGTLIRPPRPKPIYYDPLITDARRARSQAREIAKAVEKSIVDELRKVEAEAKKAGWDRLPAAVFNDSDGPRVARRIFRRAVLEEPWETIADADCVDIRTVRESVERRAAECDIPLPRIRPGPRRKNPAVSS